ncbi:hypothetical protein XPA_010031 [Xanthoria parietina]
MAQNAPRKTPSTKPSSSKRSHPLAPKKGARAIAPRKKKIVAQKALVKKYSAGLIRKTEASLAEKAGHLEMLAGGKKGGKRGGGEEKKQKDGEKKKK